MKLFLLKNRWAIYKNNLLAQYLFREFGSFKNREFSKKPRPIKREVK